jgi:DNA repair exonuclease SbcCD nuclease subunit
LLFDEVVVFTDIHFGMKNNSRVHNDDCESFIKWMVQEAKDRGVKDCIFMGDWHHNRAAINVSTLNYTVSNLQFLNDNFDNVYMIMGNHDLYYREKREINSLPMGSHYENITIVNDSVFVKDDVAIVPWLVEDEWKEIKKLNVKYIFGHFELPYFYMNAMVQMPDHGSGLDIDDFTNVSKVFSGHFHKRQERGNIVYPGNCFPHNYADAWDDERGLMFLTWDGDITYKSWPGAPKYRTLKLSELIDDPEKYLSKNTHCRVTLDVPISYEEANFIKESFVQQYGIREISLIPNKKEEHSQDWQQADGDIIVENIDTLVLSQLNDIKSDTIKNSLLVNIYNTLNT